MQRTRTKARCWAVCFALCVAVAACGQKPAEKPPAKPLTAAPEALRQMPGIEPGQYSPAVIDPLTFHKDELNAELSVRVWYPKNSDGPVPVVLFSHGNWSDRDKYDNLLRHWASHGYAVIAPTHLDGRGMARGIFNSLRFGQMGLIDARVQDMQYLLDHLSDIETQLAQAAGRAVLMGKDAVVMAGHSFGAFTAQQFAGARAIDAEDKRISTAGDERVIAVLAISPPGPMFEIINEQSWKSMRGPVLVTTGTWDSNPRFWPDWRMHLMSHKAAIPGEQYSLVIEGADHYLGNLICRPERSEAPQHDALKILNAVSTAFMNAQVHHRPDLQAYLSGAQLQTLTGDFARLEVR